MNPKLWPVDSVMCDSVLCYGGSPAERMQKKHRKVEI